MVEKTDHSGLWPSLYDPLRNFGHRVADWLREPVEVNGANTSTKMTAGSRRYPVTKLARKGIAEAQTMVISRT